MMTCPRCDDLGLVGVTDWTGNDSEVCDCPAGQRVTTFTKLFLPMVAPAVSAQTELEQVRAERDKLRAEVAWLRAGGPLRAIEALAAECAEVAPKELMPVRGVALIIREALDPEGDPA